MISISLAWSGSKVAQDIVKKLMINNPVRDLRSRLLASSSGAGEKDGKLFAAFTDFLGRCLELSPERRITPAEAFKHPFLKA